MKIRRGGISIYFKLLVSLIIGICMANRIDLFTAIACTVGIIAANLTAQIIFKNKNGYRSVIAVVFLTGICVSQYVQSYEFNDLFPVDDKFITARGYVYDIPQENEEKYTYIIKTDMAEYKQKRYDTRELIQLTTDKELTYLQNVEIRGFLKRFSQKMNSSDFDYSGYYKSKGIYYYITDYEVTGDNTLRKTLNPFLLIKKCKFYLMKITDNYLDGDYAAILKAVLVGYKKAFSEDYDDLLLTTGTKRMLFPAYLHIFLIMLVIEMLMTFFQRKHRDYAIVAALLLYALINSEATVSLKNATVAAAVVFVTQKYGTVHYPDILSGVMAIIVLFNPLLVFNSGIVISLAIGWTIFMIREPVAKLLLFVKNKRIKNFAVFWIVSNIGALPVAAYYYNSVNLYSLLLNAVYFPVVTLIIFCFPVFILEMLIFKRAFLIRYALTFSVFVLYKMPFLVDKLPFSNIYLPRPNIFFVVLWYGTMVLVKDVYNTGFRRMRTQVVAAVIAGGIVSVVVVGIMNLGTAKLTFVNVGQGDGAIIQLPKGEVITVDGGGGEEYSEYDAGEKIFLPYLKNEGIFRIDMAVLTHYHKDHCLGTIAAMKNLRVHTVAIPNVSKDNKYRQEIEKTAHEKGIEIVYLEKGDKITFESGAEIDVISPETKNYFENENDTSIVFELKCNNFKALFTGDATDKIEHDNIDDFEDIDLLKVAHHGSSTSTTQEFLDKIRPEYSIISVGENNTYMHPDDSTVYRLKNAGSEIYRTDLLGDISVYIKRNGEFWINSLYNKAE
ncbi:MAG: ComEC/Rec2 family competence protein [Clostridia bacterium]|nr:ComEC/Rec2 family competence protein [Clostridia bacterium]